MCSWYVVVRDLLRTFDTILLCNSTGFSDGEIKRKRCRAFRTADYIDRRFGSTVFTKTLTLLYDDLFEHEIFVRLKQSSTVPTEVSRRLYMYALTNGFFCGETHTPNVVTLPFFDFVRAAGYSTVRLMDTCGKGMLCVNDGDDMLLLPDNCFLLIVDKNKVLPDRDKMKDDMLYV